MYFWRIEKLKTEMAARPLSDREVLPYLVVFVLLSTIACYFPLAVFNVWDGLGALLSIVLVLGGTIYIYLQNGGNTGQHFLQRYFAIGWVVVLRCLVVMVVCEIALLTALEVIGVATDVTTWYEFLFIAITEAVIYWRIGHHVRELAQSMTET